MNARERKEAAAVMCIEEGLHRSQINKARLARIKQIEKKYDVFILIEKDHCISVWTHKTSIVRRFAAY